MSDGNGLLYLRARYYNPAQGRFLNMDPSRQEMNPYQYASSNPIVFVDPSGLICVNSSYRSQPYPTWTCESISAQSTRFEASTPPPQSGPSSRRLGEWLSQIIQWCFAGTGETPNDDSFDPLDGLGFLPLPGLSPFGGEILIIEDEDEDGLGQILQPGQLEEESQTQRQEEEECELSTGRHEQDNKQDKECEGEIVLYHYTPMANIPGILANGLNPSISIPGDPRTRDAIHGSGQYFTDIAPTEAVQVRRGQFLFAIYRDARRHGTRTPLGWIQVSMPTQSVTRVSDVYGARFPGRGFWLYPNTTTLPLNDFSPVSGGPMVFQN